MGIGRNQYIDLMNQFRSKVRDAQCNKDEVMNSFFFMDLTWQKFFRRRGIRDLLPVRPVDISRVEPWWVVHCGFVTEDDIRVRTVRS